MYINLEVLRLKNTKNKLWKRYVKSKSHYDHRAFTKCRNRLRNLTRSLRSDFEKNLPKNIKEKAEIFLEICKIKDKKRS